MAVASRKCVLKADVYFLKTERSKRKILYNHGSNWCMSLYQDLKHQAPAGRGSLMQTTVAPDIKSELRLRRISLYCKHVIQNECTDIYIYLLMYLFIVFKIFIRILYSVRKLQISSLLWQNARVISERNKSHNVTCTYVSLLRDISCSMQ